MNDFIVAIDGPAGSGKSSISKMVSKICGFTHIDTGAIFRAITLYALDKNIDLENENEYNFLSDIKIRFDKDKVFLNDNDVSHKIREDIISKNVSAVSKIKKVRDRVLEIEKESHGKIIMDGRDIGTVVFPNANLKIFLTASPEERAKRRVLQNESLGIKSNYDEILADIIKRDYKDSTRDIAPLKCADDAINIDTTSLSIEEVCNKIVNLIDERLRLWKI
ncbi:MAG: (d)CMP kinase [Acholeplasmatales bacterium]|nr:(d)CMP kinase [Acholeplasmatales bacterium]